MAMGTYDVIVNGIKHTMQFDDAEAERLGLDATVTAEDAEALAEIEAATAAKAAADAKAADAKAADAKAADAKAADAKAADPANKAGKVSTK